METSSLKVIFVVITIIFGTSIIGVGEMSDNQDDKEEGWIKKIMKNDNWYKKILDFFDFKKLKGFMNSQNTNSEDFNSENFGSEEFNSIKWICGNGKIDTDPQSDEECEPPNTATCDENCHFRPPPPPPELEHAFIDLGLDKVFVDPNGQPNTGDEYFDNLITECSFHSDESIHGNVCLACLLVDKKIEPCDDLTLSLTEFAHGTILGNTQGFPNAAIDGVT
ncbi:MAG: hypothetical protein ACREAU_09235, partial [Nitrosopumilaceae archaeon]